jgi:hypothetical protein
MIVGGRLGHDDCTVGVIAKSGRPKFQFEGRIEDLHLEQTPSQGQRATDQLKEVKCRDSNEKCIVRKISKPKITGLVVLKIRDLPKRGMIRQFRGDRAQGH